MEHADDDIDILSGHDTLDGSISDPHGLLAQNFIISRSPGNRPDPAVQALQQAYSDLKKRYNETVDKNQHMSRKLRDVGRLKTPEPDMATYGDHTDSFNSQGAAATAEHPSSEADNLRAQQGYIRYLERERTNDQARVQQLSSLKNSYEESCRTMQIKLKDTVTDLQRKEEELVRANESIIELKEDNMRLKEDRDAFRKRATELQDCMQTSMSQSNSLQLGHELDELKVKCGQLETMVNTLRTECDRLKVSEGIAQSELQTANKRIQELQQEVSNMTAKCGQMEQERNVRDSDMSSVSSLPTVQELAHLKRVIADLKNTVVQQREFLSKLGKLNMVTPARTEMCLDPANRLMVEDIGQSWENVPGEPMLAGGTGGVAVYRDAPRPPAPCRPLAIDSSVAPGNSRNSPASSPRRTNSDHASRPIHEHSRSEVLLRRASDTSHNSSRSKSEVLARTNDAVNMHDPSRHQQTFNNLGHVNGNSQYQGGSRRVTPQSVVSDVFGVVDNTPAFPVPPELRQSVTDHRSPSQHNGHSEVAEKTCPVCSRDFSAMPIEDFQTHVFECFDDQENAPETLRAGETTERICPMCNALFPEAVPQEEFEKHVQGHFEQEMIDRFEILNP